jgi:serine/threonine protein kinase
MTPVDPREAKISALLDESYEMLGHLGRGGFATVYRVRNRRLDRVEALKVLSADLEDPDFAGRFRQEARVAASLDHPHIVKIFAFGQAGDLCWFTMQLVDGPTLTRELKQKGPWSEADTATLATGVCDALEYSHRRGIVHRDIKPENILVDMDRHPYLMDFGIAKSEQSLVHTRTGTILGSPAYMAPEQLTAGVVDGRADIYSLGATLYRMVSNRLPFEDTDPVRMAMKRFTMPPEPLGSRRPGIDPVFESIVMRALEREPSARFQTAAELGRALRAFLAGAPVALPSPRPAGGISGPEGATGEQTPRMFSGSLPSTAQPAFSASSLAAVAAGGAAADSSSIPTIRTAPAAAAPAPPVAFAAAPAPAPAAPTRRLVWSAAVLLVALAVGVLLWSRYGAAPERLAAPQTDRTEPTAAPVPTRGTESTAPAISSTPPSESVRAEVEPTAAPPANRPTPAVPRPTRVPAPPARVLETEEHSIEPPRRAVVPAQTEESEPALDIAPAVAREFANRVVGLSVVIAEDGSVREAHVISPLCPECDRAALAAMRRYRFKAARDARGRPVESHQAVSVMIPSPDSP